MRNAISARLATGALVLAAALSPGLWVAPAQAEDPTVFRVALLNDVDSLNPFLGIEAYSFEMWALTYDYLISYSMEDMSVEPGLAREWETSADGLTWTFTIQDGVTWSDGEPLTAADIAYTYNRVLDGGPEAASWETYLTNVKKVSAPDATTLILNLEKANATLPLIPIPIVPEHVWGDVSDKEMASYSAEPEAGKPVVGSGPFRLVEGTAGGSTYRFEANPDYWQGAPHIDEVVFTVYKSADPAIQALRNGEVDFVEDLNALQVKALQGAEGITALNGTSPGFDEIAFNTGAVDLKTNKPIGDAHPAVLDPKFRYALGFAIDRDELIEKAYQGAGTPGTSIIPSVYQKFHWEPTEEVAFSFDLERAGALLDEAGYKLGSDGARQMPDGKPMKPIRMIGRSESPTSTKVVQFVSEWWESLGIPVETSAKESSQLTEVIYSGNYDVFEWGWYVEPDPQSMLSYLTCGQRGNWSDTWWCNKTYDELFQAQAEELDPAARAEVVKQMQELVYTEAPYLLTAYSAIGEAYRSDRFACFTPQPNPDGILLVQYGVHNYKNIRPAAEAEECADSAQAVSAGGSDETTSGLSRYVVGGAGLAIVLSLTVFAIRRRAREGDRE